VDYSELKGLEVKYIKHPQGLKFKDCYVHEIDDCGLTIKGYVLDDPKQSPNQEIKVFCLRNEIPEHLELFPVVVKMILIGKFNKVFEINDQCPLVGGQPTCAFE
jgi:hypothetical protein